MPEFEKWWNDLKKHRKRCDHWLPRWKVLAEKIGEKRDVRYLTLCARSMIDVFMLVREKLLKLDAESGAIASVRFCECDQEQFAEITDLVATEGAGFFGRIEDVILFVDDPLTAQCPTVASINEKLEDERLQEDYAQIDRLQLKRTHFELIASFPYDFINLDFCDYYYPLPPDMLRINEAIKRVLDWERRPSDEGDIQVDEFILTVTCKHDGQFPQQAEQRLAALIEENCKTSPQYGAEVKKTRGEEIKTWMAHDKEDFFFAGWPKDIAHSAKEYGWVMDILDYVYYRREGDHDNQYVIACLVARFKKADSKPNNIAAAIYALAVDNRLLIADVDRTSADGKTLLADLADIVKLRNTQAQKVDRPELPAP